MFCDNQFKNYSRVYTLSQLSHIFKKNCTQYMYELHILIFVCSKVLYWTEGTWTGGRRTNRYFQCIKVKKCYPNMASRAPSIFSFKSSSFSGNSIIIKMYICTYLVKLQRLSFEVGSMWNLKKYTGPDSLFSFFFSKTHTFHVSLWHLISLWHLMSLWHLILIPIKKYLQQE